MTTIEKIGLYLGIGIVLLILGLIFFSTNGVMDYRALTEKEARITARVRKESQENKRIEKEINRLKHDLEYIRHKARHDHGMAAPDELIFKHQSTIKDPNPKDLLP
ncbi:MAG: septum formation initiator family protein [Desulfobacter sp.]|nr:MAG: septum formation initiator family protein [Desulfobacter sp.]